MIFVWPLQSGNYVSHVIRNTQTSLTEMNHVNGLTSYVLHKQIHILYCVCILVLCVILLFFYTLQLYVFVLICQYYVVLLERINIYIYIYIYIYIHIHTCYMCVIWNVQSYLTQYIFKHNIARPIWWNVF